MVKKEKGVLDLSEIKVKGTKRKSWSNSIGKNIYYYLDNKKYIFKLVDYKKENQTATLLYDNKEYNITTSNILDCNFGNIIGTCVKYFRYNVGEEIKTKRKNCIIIDRFRNEKGKKSYSCKCIDCGNIKTITEDNLEKRGFICNVCSDKISYPERFVGSFLSQLGVAYEYQKRFDWSKEVICKNKKLQSDKIYDYYIPLINSIIEVHGEIHYKLNRWSKCRPMDEMIENDNLKRDIAIKNNIENYIILDCKESDSNYIRRSILESELNNLFDLPIIDWDKCALDATTSLMKRCSDLWNDGVRPAQLIADKIGISKQTVVTYLKKFAKLGLNDYDPKKEIKSGSGKIPANAKKVVIIKDGICLGFFNSATELDRKSLELYGVKLNQGDISRVARGEHKTYKGFRFKYVQDLTNEEKAKFGLDKAI